MKFGVFWDVTLVRTDVSEEFSAVFLRSVRSSFTDSCHADEGGAKLLRNVGSYKSNTA
jgi:hypothetical protein